MNDAMCSVDGCDTRRYCRGYCIKHYRRWKTHGDPTHEQPKMPTVCTVDDCHERTIARGWCSRHYKRWQTYGVPVGVGEDRGSYSMSTVDRFWTRVEKTETCWLWHGADSGDGYGRMRGPDGVTVGVHRFAYELLVGPIPDGLELDHVWARGCTHRNCVNPDHLEPVTAAENTRRSNSATAVNGRKTHCAKGHPLSGANLHQRDSGHRICLTCRRDANRKSKAKARMRE